MKQALKNGKAKDAEQTSQHNMVLVKDFIQNIETWLRCELSMILSIFLHGSGL